MVERQKKSSYKYGLKEIKQSQKHLDLVSEQLSSLETGYDTTKFVRRGMQIVEVPRSVGD
jgi:hypothetical protein